MRTLAEFMEERGEQKGLAKGIERGILQGQREQLLRLLRRRFGQLPADVVAWVAAGDARSLERWSESFVDAHSLEDIFFDEFTATR
jgi:hypothetical protein